MDHYGADITVKKGTTVCEAMTEESLAALFGTTVAKLNARMKKFVENDAIYKVTGNAQIQFDVTDQFDQWKKYAGAALEEYKDMMGGMDPPTPSDVDRNRILVAVVSNGFMMSKADGVRSAAQWTAGVKYQIELVWSMIYM